MSERTGSGGDRERGVFAALGRWVVRHPWHPVIFWVALLLVTLPFLSHLSSVTTNSASNLPSGAPSVVAQAQLDRLFPNQTVGSVSVLLLNGPNVTGTAGQRSVLALSAAIGSDPRLRFVDGVGTLYSAYGQYLAGTTLVDLGVLQAGLNRTPNLTATVTGDASLLWGPPALFLTEWRALVASHPSTPADAWNYPAFRSALSLTNTSPARLILSTFYNGTAGTRDGFNGTAACANDTVSFTACADRTARATSGTLLSQLAPPAAQAPLAAALALMGTGNYSTPNATDTVGAALLASNAGVSYVFLAQVWTEFPSGAATVAQVAAWTSAVVSSGTPASWALPVPPGIWNQFVDPSNSSTVLFVSFSKPSGFTDPAGQNPVYSDVVEINQLVPTVLASTDPGHSFQYWQTGGASLDQEQSVDLSNSLAIVLPLTIVVLLLITVAYFRAPFAPAITFGGLAIALALGIGGVLLVGTFVTKVDPTALTLENTFVLGVGTDYSIFLVARYREELFAGKSSPEAVVRSVTWAGQSIATSGATAILATLALAFSGVGLLSQWGMVLSLAVLFTVLISLTMVPALLVLIGPRIFWPATGARFEKRAKEARDRIIHERTYFYRAGRLAQRRPKTIVALVLLASVPLLYVAVQVPLSFDYYQQLPSHHPAADGLKQLSSHFGPGFAFPMNALVTFAAPLRSGNVTNATDFQDLGALTSLLAGTPGVQSIGSPVGSGGAPLSTWLNLSHQPRAVQRLLEGVLDSFVSTDQRTVLMTIVPSTSGLSADSVHLLNHLQEEVGGFQGSHPEVTSVGFAGGAAVTRDLQQQTAVSTERMVIAVSIGLVIVLFAVLRSWIIPAMAVATIGLSIGWAWGITYLVLGRLLGDPLFFFVPTVLFILILGLGIDYNIFLLTRVREERLKGRSSREAAVQAVASTGGIITAAAVILASAFAILVVGNFILLEAIGFAVATAILLDAMIVRTYLVPSLLHLMGDRVWPRGERTAGSEPDPGSAGPPPAATRSDGEKA